MVLECQELEQTGDGTDALTCIGYQPENDMGEIEGTSANNMLDTYLTIGPTFQALCKSSSPY